MENTLENRNILKAQWINEQAAGCPEWKEHARQWQEMVNDELNLVDDEDIEMIIKENKKSSEANNNG